jgi:hypothetical protein
MTEEVFDLDALAAEAEQHPFKFTFGGEEYERPPMDMKLATEIDGLSMVEVFRKLLGDEQWDRIVASTSRLTQPMFVALLDRWESHYGSSLGESRASRRSSQSTARPSKRTSHATSTVH